MNNLCPAVADVLIEIQNKHPEASFRTIRTAIKDIYVTFIGNEVHVVTDCTVTNRAFKVVVTKDQWDQYQLGLETIQNIFSDKSPDQREVFINGYTPAEWNFLFDMPPPSDEEMRTLGYV
jgi:hypothetical protein